MKKIFSVLAAATLFAACSSNDLDSKKDVVVTDTAGMYKSNYSTDVSNPVADPQVNTVQRTKVIRETRVVYVDRTPKTKKPVYQEATPVPQVIQPQPQTQTNTQTTASTNPSDNTGVSGNTGNTGNGSGNETATTQTEKKKEGWSNATKDAVIGGVGGAVLGAVISKKKGKGAVIGGVLGAAGGYILGKKKDKAAQQNMDETADAKFTSY